MGFTNMAYCFIFKELLFEIIVILPQRVCLFSGFLFFYYSVFQSPLVYNLKALTHLLSSSLSCCSSFSYQTNTLRQHFISIYESFLEFISTIYQSPSALALSFHSYIDYLLTVFCNKF